MTNENEEDYDEDLKLNSNKEKITYFFEKKIPVHLLKRDRIWFNGIIVELTDSQTFLIKDQRIGEKKVFYSDVYDIDIFTEEDAQ